MALRLEGRVDRPWRFLATAIVIVIVVLFYADWRAFQNAASQVDQTRQLEQQTDGILASITDAETAQRGYLLTGDRKYLTPYEKAVVDLPRELDALAGTAAAAQRQVKQVAWIRSLIETKMAELKRTIELQDQEGVDAALALVRTDEGRLTMDEVRSAGKVLMSAEYLSLYELEKTSEMHANRFRIVVLTGCLCLVFLLFRLGSGGRHCGE